MGSCNITSCSFYQHCPHGFDEANRTHQDFSVPKLVISFTAMSLHHNSALLGKQYLFQIILFPCSNSCAFSVGQETHLLSSCLQTYASPLAMRRQNLVNCFSVLLTFPSKTGLIQSSTACNPTEADLSLDVLLFKIISKDIK